MQPFPQPHKIGLRSTRWRLSELEAYENGSTDRKPEDEVYLSVRQTAKRYSVQPNAIWQWARMSRQGHAA